MSEVNNARISEIAHRLWEENGSPVGRDDEFWYAAEHLLADEKLAEDPADLVDALPLMAKSPAPPREPGA